MESALQLNEQILYVVIMMIFFWQLDLSLQFSIYFIFIENIQMYVMGVTFFVSFFFILLSFLCPPLNCKKDVGRWERNNNLF